jgi:hypothetical protein
MSVNDHSFLSQRANDTILLHVANVCAECYHDFHVGDSIYYDMEGCRYLCLECAEHLSDEMNVARDIEEQMSNSLF